MSLELKKYLYSYTNNSVSRKPSRENNRKTKGNLYNKNYFSNYVYNINIGVLEM